MVHILGSGVALGLIAFSVSLLRDSTVKVAGYVEVARAYTVNADGATASEAAVNPVLLVRRVNAAERSGKRGASSLKEPASAVARVARGGDVIEIEARSSSALAATERVQQIVAMISAETEPARTSAWNRLAALEKEIGEEATRLTEWRNSLDRQIVERAKEGSRSSDGSLMLGISMIRADADRELRELKAQRRAYRTAMDMMNERRTRLVVPVFVETPLGLAAVGAGAAGFFVGSLAAGALVFLRGKRPTDVPDTRR
jgi:hypothetical protein